MRTIADIISASGGVRSIQKAIERGANKPITTDAIYKWLRIGIPERHWCTLMELANTSPAELFYANRLVRGEMPNGHHEEPSN